MVTIAALSRDDSYLEDLGADIWLMDNHKWALWVWESFRQEHGGKFTLAHADYHWDGGYDVHDDPDQEQRLLAADLAGLRSIIEAEEWVRYDSFIAPAIARGALDAVHFYCLQGDSMGDIGIVEDFLNTHGVVQSIHDTPESFASLEAESTLIFDLCLDLFNKSVMTAQGDLWRDAGILTFLDVVRPLIANAALVTISLSFDCSGTADDTRHLASLVLPQIKGWRAA